MTKADRVRVASYRRSVGASLERVWENVLDWEHLPWLHRDAFSAIECEEAGEWGWRARIGLRAGGRIRLELVRSDGADRYVSRTLEGPGAGTEIWTGLRAETPQRTAVEVDFELPAPGPEHAEAVGRAFVALYTRLWDEDEAMMGRRQAELSRARSAPAGELDLGPAAALRARLPLALDAGGQPLRVVELDGRLLAHATVCPHRLGPLDGPVDEEGGVRCPWHGYRFDLRSGRCDGRRGLRLATAPVEVDAAGRARLRLP